MNITATVRFKRNGEFENSEDYDVEIPDDTKEDDELDKIMDALRPIISAEFEGDEDWENGDIDWEVYSW